VTSARSFQLPDSIKLQTRIKIGEDFIAQGVPLQATAPRPAFLEKVKLGLEEEKNAPPPQQSFLRRYVSSLRSSLFSGIISKQHFVVCVRQEYSNSVQFILILSTGAS
jgi:hypothetical protein